MIQQHLIGSMYILGCIQTRKLEEMSIWKKKPPVHGE